MGTFYETDHRDILDRFVISKDNSGIKTYSERKEKKEKSLINLMMIIINIILLEQNKIRKGKVKLLFVASTSTGI